MKYKLIKNFKLSLNIFLMLLVIHTSKQSLRLVKLLKKSFYNTIYILSLYKF